MDLITTPAQVGYTPADTAIVHSTTASLTSRAPVQPVHLVQYDQTVPIVAVSLTANGQPYTVPSGAAVNVRMDKPDGHHVYDPALGLSSDSQTVYIGITAQMTAASGNSNPIVEIVVDGGAVGTAAFPVIIDKNPVPDSAIESSDEWLTIEQILQQVEEAAAVVQQNAQNLQNLTDNLEAVQNAAGNAQAAAASAAAAQQAAQEALGFRTFFSAVTPDENGDLDPSRPMTTPTAASVTVKSKGDRIQSVQVHGFTTQAGSGDASPTNVRKISTAGMKLVELVLTGDENFYLSSSIANQFQCTALAPNSKDWTALSNRYKPYNGTDWTKAPDYSVFNSGGYISITDSSYNNADAFKARLKSLYNAGTPVTVWYIPADESQATGLYIPVETQGHEYRCQCLELTAPLCAGDKVESCVPSGCEKTITVDGSTVTVTASGSNYVVTAADAAAGGNVYAEGLAYLSLTAGTIVIPATSFPASVTSAQTANVWLQSNPQKVWYKSTAYTEENDIPVQLETHVYNKMTFDGTEGFSYSPASKLIYINFPDAVANQNTTIVCSAYTGGGAGTGENKCAINSAKDFTLYGPYESLESGVSVVTSLASAGTPVTVVYKLAIPAIYAHDPVTIVAIPYTQADVDAANQLANTPSTLPAIDSPDVPMLLNSADNTDSAAQVMALAANAVPVAGTYVVSSQDGTTVTVSLKAMQDGGDAATLGGLTADQILAQTPTALSASVLSVISAQATVSSVPVGASGTAFSATLTVPDGYTALEPLYASVGSAGAVANLDAFTSGAGAVTGTVYNLTQAELQNVAITIYILAVKIGG